MELSSEPKTILKPFSFKKGKHATKLTLEEVLSLFYHNVFDYPLSQEELFKWVAGKKIERPVEIPETKETNGFFHLATSKGLLTKRAIREKVSVNKLKLATNAAEFLSRIPAVRMVGLTGALAMANASEESDIDLLVVTKKGTLWTTRALSVFFLKLFGFNVRRYGKKESKDALCINMWMDEGSLVWRKRSAYSAHELAQIKPLVNKNKTFEKLISKNLWIKDYWPNAINYKNHLAEDKNQGGKEKINPPSFLFQFVENLSMAFQLWYMKGKITRETVTRTRALFHPVDWEKYVIGKLQ